MILVAVSKVDDDDDDDDFRPSQAKTTTTSIPGFCGCEDG